MEGMLIVTVLNYNFNEHTSSCFAKQIKKLIEKGYKDILVDLTNVNSIENPVIEKLHDVSKLLKSRGGNMKIFGVDPDVAGTIFNNKVGYLLNLQVNEVIDSDLADLLFYREISLAS